MPNSVTTRLLSIMKLPDRSRYGIPCHYCFHRRREETVRFIAILASVLLLTASLANAAQSDFRVTLIGSGTPVPAADRFGPATLVEPGNQKFLFDVGRGATIRLWQLK